MKLNSIRFNISFLYVAILGVILIIYSGILYFSLKHILYDVIDNELAIKAQDITNTIDSYLNLLGNDQESFLFAVKKAINLDARHPSQYKIKEFENDLRKKGNIFSSKKEYINFIVRDWETIISSNNVTNEFLAIFVEENRKNNGKGDTYFRNIKFGKNKLRMIGIKFSREAERNCILQIATSLDPVSNILNNRLLSVFIIILIILFLAAFVGQLFAVRILKPVFEITKTAKNITHENLNARVKAEHIDIEMRYLVDAFNDMIQRLEESFKYIMEFSTYVAHELKTPLAIIVGESEVALRKSQNDEEYKRVIQINLEEAGRMLKTINDLLLLTRLECKPDVFKYERIDTEEFFSEIYEQSKILSSPKDINVHILLPKKTIYFYGDKLHLRRLFFNLIDNAIKFTPHNGRIDITLRIQGKSIIVSISDTGIGIPEEDLPEIFNRFFRGENAYHISAPGSGLGLSIALSIAKIHGGEILVKSMPGKGTTFTVQMPLTRDSQSKHPPQSLT